MSVLTDVGPAAWIEQALTRTARSETVASMVPPMFPAYARVLPPTYDPDDERRYRWSEIAAQTGVVLTAQTRFDDLGAGSTGWGRPSDGGLDARETQILARLLADFTASPEEAYFCLWEGFGSRRPRPGWTGRCACGHRTGRTTCLPDRLPSHRWPAPLEWRCASLWWPADRSWLVATEIDGYLTYLGASRAAIDAVLSDPALDAVPVDASTPLDPSYG